MNAHIACVFNVWPYLIQEDSFSLLYWYLLTLKNISKISWNIASISHWFSGYTKRKLLSTTIKYTLEDQYKT